MKKWLFLRGLMRGQFHWHHFPAALKQALPDSEFYFIDLPGNGFNCHMASLNTISAMLAFARERLQQNQLATPINIVSISLGGMVTLEWCRQYPEEIASAVVINTSVSNLSHFYQRFNLLRLPQMLRYLNAGHNYRQKEQAIIRMTSQAHQYDHHLLNRWEELQRRYPVSFKNAYQQLIAAAKFKLFDPVKVPVLCVNSEADQLVSHRCSQNLASFLDAPLKTHTTAGHDLPLDDPKWLATTISEWYQANAIPNTDATSLKATTKSNLALSIAG